MKALKLLSLPCISLLLGIAGAEAQQPKLIEVASFGKYQPIGLTVAPATNRLFVSFPHREPFQYGLTEIINGKCVPFPNEDWNKYLPEQSENHFVNVQDLHADDQNFLWVLDSKPGGSNGGQFKLLKINLLSNKVDKVYLFEDLPKQKSALNDMVIDNERQLAYLSDPGAHAIVVLDLNTGKSRIVLQDDRSTVVQPGLKLHLDGKDVADAFGNPFISNVNGIALQGIISISISEQLIKLSYIESQPDF